MQEGLNQVIVHDPQHINALLCDRHQPIGKTPKREAEGPRKTGDQIDFTKYPFPEPIEARQIKTVSQEPTIKKEVVQQQPQSKLSQIRRDMEFIDKMSESINVYEVNFKRKTIAMHQELEEHYFHPIAHKISKKMSGPGYEDYLKKRNRAITRFDKSTRQLDTYNQPLPDIPTLQINTHDIIDPLQRYKYHAEKERALSTLIAKTNGTYTAPPTFPERDTMNLKKWKILAETRFYSSQSGQPVSKGKKFYPTSYQSQVGDEINQFH